MTNETLFFENTWKIICTENIPSKLHDIEDLITDKKFGVFCH